MKKIIGLLAVGGLFFGWNKLTNPDNPSNNGQNQNDVTVNEANNPSYDQMIEKVQSLVNLEEYEQALDEVDALLAGTGFSLREMDALRIIKEDIIDLDTLELKGNFSPNEIKQTITNALDGLLNPVK